MLHDFGDLAAKNERARHYPDARYQRPHPRLPPALTPGAEIAAKYPHFRFDHCYGLGVVLVGSNPPAPCGTGQPGPVRGRRYGATLFFPHAGAICEAPGLPGLEKRKEQEKEIRSMFPALKRKSEPTGRPTPGSLTRLARGTPPKLRPMKGVGSEEKRKGEAEARGSAPGNSQTEGTLSPATQTANPGS